MKHPERVVDSQSPFETGERASYFEYQDLEDLFLGMSFGLKIQADGDMERNRPQLAKLGMVATEKIGEVVEVIKEMKSLSGENEIIEKEEKGIYWESGRSVSYLRYDALDNYLSGMASGFDDQVERDIGDGYKDNAEVGKKMVKKVNEVSDVINRMWKISEPYMKGDL